ncbi:transposase [Streptomyces echinatus]|uniref:transposase n=1 Tax=Streptomyces echinatus TaxID=67293 RepID=UPI00378CDE02
MEEFAFRRGCTYGTVLVDVEAGRVVDVLPDRTSETFAAWLTERPGAEIICRDRATAYTKAVRAAAPHALELADDQAGQKWPAQPGRRAVPPQSRMRQRERTNAGKWVNGEQLLPRCGRAPHGRSTRYIAILPLLAAGSAVRATLTQGYGGWRRERCGGSHGTGCTGRFADTCGCRRCAGGAGHTVRTHLRALAAVACARAAALGSWRPTTNRRLVRSGRDHRLGRGPCRVGVRREGAFLIGSARA